MEKNLPIGARDLPRAPRSSSKWPRGDVALVDGYIKAQTAVHTAVWAFFYAGGAKRLSFGDMTLVKGISRPKWRYELPFGPFFCCGAAVLPR